MHRRFLDQILSRRSYAHSSSTSAAPTPERLSARIAGLRIFVNRDFVKVCLPKISWNLCFFTLVQFFAGYAVLEEAVYVLGSKSHSRLQSFVNNIRSDLTAGSNFRYHK